LEISYICGTKLRCKTHFDTSIFPFFSIPLQKNQCSMGIPTSIFLFHGILFA